MNAKQIRAGLSSLALLAAAALTTMPAAAQAPAPMKLTVVVAGRTQTLRGAGKCGYEPNGYIYGRAAALWSVDYDAAGQPSVSLSFWRHKAAGAGDQFSLSVSSGKAQHVIDTVKGSTPAGSGRATFRPTALGGRFEIQGKASDGTPLQVTIECARFGGIYAEGG